MRTVQLTTDGPGGPGQRSYDVDDGEYERLTDLGIVVNAVANPNPAGLFDAEVAALMTDTGSDTYAAGRSAFTPRAQSIAPASPAVGELWVT